MHLDPIQELLSQHQQIVGAKSAVLTGVTTSSSLSQSAAASLNQQHRQTGGQNSSSNYSSGSQQPHRVRRESAGTLTSSATQGRAIPPTPSSREKSLNLKNTGSNNNSSELVIPGTQPADPDSTEMIENSNGKKVRPRSFWTSWLRF
jgi:hypothetical protein